MATCRDCFHCDACAMIAKSSFPSLTKVQIEAALSRNNGCKNFKAQADVVEVVRCGECKHYGTSGCAMDAFSFDVTEESFCSYGERRENEQT